ncbi:MAG: TetR/AcrR family transcriptional regulator [Candidatus Hydrogenedentes bacterium]|nr:TetR/AcrR family transcriptional regulator [Candidatus Hydrogenedentota bacterium]HOJ68861.1 TetR/AcrR family transcriptional regulator [Candidatus Hydrogenedentota bacterium]
MEHALNARQRSRIETRKRLLRAGGKLFARKGVATTTAAEIAREAGVAVGTLYLHFGDKSGLLRTILTEGVESLLQAMTAVTDRNEDTCSRHQVELLVRFAEKNRELCLVLFDPESIRLGAAAEVMERLTRVQSDRIRQRCGERADTASAYLAAQAMVGMVMHGIYWWVRHHKDVDARAVSDILFALRDGAMKEVVTML